MRSKIIMLIMLILVSCSGKKMSLSDRISSLSTIEVTEISPDTTVFNKAFEIIMVQAIDHDNPEIGEFGQKIYLSYVDSTLPVVVVTEGYTANSNYTTELARELKCNQIIIEHRYFGESIPEKLDWEYMNTYQAASDHHQVIELFKEFFSGKFLTTGISKGGQTVMFHSYYFPEDADVRVPYVAPLNLGPEDERIYTFLDTVRTDYCRDRVMEAQKHILNNRELYFPMIMELVEQQGMTFEKVGGPEVAFELAVLEYDFAYWQWGRTACEDILLEGDPEEIFKQFFRISGPYYFSDSGAMEMEAFFYQALTEIGYYGYEFEKFGDLLQYARDADEYEFSFAMPVSEYPDFDYDLVRNLDEYIESANNFIYIYGMQDTWSATSVNLSEASNSIKILKKEGDHLTRIMNLPDYQRELVWDTLKEWLRN